MSRASEVEVFCAISAVETLEFEVAGGGVTGLTGVSIKTPEPSPSLLMCSGLQSTQPIAFYKQKRIGTTTNYLRPASQPCLNPIAVESKSLKGTGKIALCFQLDWSVSSVRSRDFHSPPLVLIIPIGHGYAFSHHVARNLYGPSLLICWR